jgi:hypothetical protein
MDCGRSNGRDGSRTLATAPGHRRHDHRDADDVVVGFAKGALELHGVGRLCVMTGLPNPPLTAGSFPATILSGR